MKTGVKSVNSADSNVQRSSRSALEEKLNIVVEDVCKFVTIFITIYMSLILYQSSKINDFINDRSESLNPWEFLWVIPGIAYSYGLYFLSTKYLANYFTPYLTKVSTRTDETLAQRLHRVGVNLMGLIYYVSSFVTLFYLSYGTEFLPTIYGGYLEIDNYLATWPVRTSKTLRIVYLVGLGHHLERLAMHMIQSRHSITYYTMNLHHILTVYLIALSFFMNHFVVGVAVFLLHDLSDALLWASRLLRETVFERITIVTFALMALSWFVTRVYAFLVEVIVKLVYVFAYPQHIFKEFYFSHLFLFASLFMLATLNIYWSFQIAQIAVTRFVKKQNSFALEDSKGRKKAE